MKNNHTFASFVLLLGAVLFSLKAVLVKLCYQYDAEALHVLTLRMLFAMPFFLVFTIKNQAFFKGLPQRIWLKIIGLSFVGYYLASLFDFFGLIYIPAGIERLILFTYPTIIVLLNRVFNQKKISHKQLIALLLTYIGIGIAFLSELEQGGAGRTEILTGGVLVLGSAIAYAVYIFGSGNIIPTIGSKNFTSLAMLFSTLFVLTHFALTDHLPDLLQYEWPVYAYTLLMAVFSTVIPSYLISYGIQHIGSNNAGIIGSIGPISTIIMAYLFLGELFTYLQVFGTILVLSGILLISLKINKNG